MICCKIIADYSSKEASFSKLCDWLSKKGDWLWAGGYIYFADTEGDTTEKQIVRAVKKAEYTKVYVEIYDKGNEPKEDEVVKNWLVNKTVKIYYNQIENDTQQELHKAKRILDDFNKELDAIIEQARQNSKNTEDNE